MALWWLDEYTVFPLIRNRDECMRVDGQIIRHYVRDSMKFTPHGDIELAKRAFKCGVTRANMKGGEINAN